MNTHKNFFHLFGNREYKELLGRSRENLLVLLAIFFVTFTAIGFSNGSLSYLSRKMKSPFVNWVSMAVPFDLTEAAVDFKNTLNQRAIQTEYHIKNVTSFNETPMNFWSPAREGTVVTIGRSIEVGDPILHEILNSRNLIAGRGFSSEQDIGFIVTESLITDLGYSSRDQFILWRFKYTDTTYRNIPLPIIAIVKELPGRHRFAVTPYMYNVLWENPSCSPFNPHDEIDILCYLAVNETKASVIRNELEVCLYDMKRKDAFVLPSVLTHYETHNPGYLAKITFRPRPQSLEVLDSIFDKLIACQRLSPYKNDIMRYYNHAGRLPQAVKEGRYHYLSVNFSSLSSIRQFSGHILTLNPDLKIDMAQVEAKENYDFISRLTRIILFIFIIFSVYAVSMFLSNVLRMHLKKISVNLGTLMAFGIDNAVLRHIYLRIAFRFATLAMLAALAGSALIGYSGGIRYLLWVFRTGVESGENYFSIINPWTLITIIAIWLVGYLSVNRTLDNLLKITPGDLVYERV